MLELINKLLQMEIVRFIIVGIICTAIDLVCYNLSLFFFPYIVCAYIGFVCSFIVNYYLSAKWTFRKRPTVRNLTGMITVHLFNLLVMRTLLLYIVIDCLSYNERLGYVIVLGLCFITSFILNKIVFDKL